MFQRMYTYLSTRASSLLSNFPFTISVFSLPFFCSSFTSTYIPIHVLFSHVQERKAQNTKQGKLAKRQRYRCILGTCLVQISAGTPIILNEVPRNFRHSFQANAEAVPQIGLCLLPSLSRQIHHSLS